MNIERSQAAKRTFTRSASLVALLCTALAGAAWGQSIPPYVFSGPLLPQILLMPGNSWLKVNTNLYRDVWTPPELEPLHSGNPSTPAKIIQPWSGFAWDSNRGDLLIYGGGHANYPGNDVYRWRSSTLQWERASLPSEISHDPVEGWTAIDGVDAAPVAAHTYDNNTFLPIADRFLTWGGATYNGDGGPYRKILESDPTKIRITGPYLFDPSRADGNKVGGTTGSNVRRVFPAPITGGQMWENRDIPLHLAGQSIPEDGLDGCSVAVVEGGRDVLYVGATHLYGTDLSVWRYQLTDINNPALDQSSMVGAYNQSAVGITTCGYDPTRKLFVRTGTNTTPFVFWDLTKAGPTNLDQLIQVDPTIASLQSWLTAQGLNIANCAIKFDPVRHTFPLWCGAATIWELHSPAAGNTASGWTITKLPPPPSLANPPGDTGGTGVLGKWRYADYYDVFVGLEDINEGHIWIYKPNGWAQPNPSGNALPTVSISAPANGTTMAPGNSLNLTAIATDSNGTISRVEFWANGVKLGQDTSAPYTISWTPLLVGTYAIVAIAVDNVGGMTASTAVNLNVSAPITTAIMQRGVLGYAGVSDTFLNSVAPTAPFGASTPLYLNGGTYTPLVRFAVFQSEGGPVPNGAVIQSAKLELYKQSYDYTLQLNALLKPWVESQATWQVSQTGVAWSVAGAAGSGTDYVAAPDVVTAGSFNPGWMAFDVTSRMRQWSNGIGTNFGWRMAENPAMPVNSIVFNSSEHTTDTTLRPKLTVVYAPPTGNAPPTVAIATPPNGASIALGASFALTANASDVDGTVALVEYFANGGKVGQAATAPYSLTWVPAAAGSYVLTARATDNLGAMTTSAPITVTVTGSGNAPPTVAIATPPNGASIALGASFALTANAGDVDGTVALVEYFVNGGKVGQAATAPYSLTWVPAAAGSYVLTARATDNLGAMTTSAPITVSVTSGSGTTTAVMQRGLSGYAGVVDTFLDNYLRTTVRGGMNPLYVDPANYRPLLRFAIFQSEGGPVPNGATIQSAKLELYKQYYDDTFRLNALLKPWVESQATWMLSQTGNAWSVAGAAGSGTDFDATVDAQVAGGFNPGWVTFDVTPRVQLWANGSATNYGWRMAQTSAGYNSKTFNSSEYVTDTTLRPKLTVVYAAPPANAPPTVAIATPPGGASITLGASFALTANAGDVDGTVTLVEYFANGGKVGQATTAPYSVTWVPAAVGSYVLTARATDNLGAMTTSSPITPVTVTSGSSTTTVVMQRGLSGYAGATDTFLDNYLPTTVRGGMNPLYLDAPNYRPLLRFAIFQSEGGPVPNGATIQSAKLELYKQYYDDTLRLNALLKPWVESQATWLLSQTGIAWSVGGAGGSGTDYNAAIDAQLAAGFNPGWVAFDVTPRVQQWAINSGTNFGWRMVQTSNGYSPKTFNSSEYATNITLRPKLTIVYK